MTFHPSLGLPSKADPVVNNFGCQPHTKPGPETIVPRTMAEQPNNEAATVLSDILGCPGKKEGQWGLPCPHLLELNYAPQPLPPTHTYTVAPLSEDAPVTCALQLADCACNCMDITQVLPPTHIPPFLFLLKGSVLRHLNECHITWPLTGSGKLTREGRSQLNA